MTNHPAAEGTASEVRAEMARQRRTAADLAEVLAVTPHTAGRRLNGSVSFSVVELVTIASWLDVPVAQLLGSTPEAVSA